MALPFSPPTLVLLPGLAADASIFAPQLSAFPNLIIPPWPSPLPTDTLDSYALRLATSLPQLHPSLRGPLLLGGASFGGIVALHVARHLAPPLRPLCVLLIGSARSPASLPRLAKLARPLRHLIPLLPIRLLQAIASPSSSPLAHQFAIADPTLLKWSLRELLAWQTTPPLPCPLLQIHGTHDRLLPYPHASPDSSLTPIPHAGHVLSLTHPTELNTFLRSALAQFQTSPP